MTISKAAKKVLEDHCRFVLNNEQWVAVIAALDAPARVLPNLHKTLSQADDWDADKFVNKQS